MRRGRQRPEIGITGCASLNTKPPRPGLRPISQDTGPDPEPSPSLVRGLVTHTVAPAHCGDPSVGASLPEQGAPRAGSWCTHLQVGPSFPFQVPSGGSWARCLSGGRLFPVARSSFPLSLPSSPLPPFLPAFPSCPGPQRKLPEKSDCHCTALGILPLNELRHKELTPSQPALWSGNSLFARGRTPQPGGS